MAGQFDPAIFHVLNWRFIFHILVEKPLALLLLCVLHRHIMQTWAYGPTTSTGGTQMPLTDFVLAAGHGLSAGEYGCGSGDFDA